MNIRELFARHARAAAKGRAVRAAARVALLGASGVAIVVLLTRLGVAMPLTSLLPALPADADRSARLFGFLAVSLAGLAQGAVLLGLVVLASVLVRTSGRWLMRMGPQRVASDLDGALETDRYSAALEARGPMAPLVERSAIDRDPPVTTLLGPLPGLRQRWLFRLVVLLTLVVALLPGTAPGSEGDAPVAGDPDGGMDARPLLLLLMGPSEPFPPGKPVPVQVLMEALAAPSEDLDLEVRISVDGNEPQSTEGRLFLAAGAPGQDMLRLDLRYWAESLEPGEHVAQAFAGVAQSNLYRFTIQGDGGGGGGQQEQEQQDQDENQKPPPKPQGGGERPDWKPKFVKPLVREGPKIRKKARVPVEVPGGGSPTDQPLEQAWPELERRKEAALNRPGLSPVARDLVREYFEQLRPEEVAAPKEEPGEKPK